MASKIIDLALPTNLPLLGSELLEMSEGGAKSIKVAVYEAMTRLYYDSTAPVLITDSTGVTVFGNIVCDDLFTSGDTIHVGSGLIKSTAGDVRLFNQDLLAMKTTNDGINIYEPANNARYLRIDVQAGETNLRSVENSSIFKIEAKDSGGTNTPLVYGDPDGAVELYYDGTKALETTEDAGVALYFDGSKVFQTGDQQIEFIDGSKEMWISYSGDQIDFTNRVNSGGLALKGFNSGGSTRTMFLGDPDGGATLYYNGTQSFKTSPGGIYVIDTSGDNPTASFFEDEGTTFLGNISFQSTGVFNIYDGVNSEYYLRAQPNSSIDIYYNGEEISSSITIKGNPPSYFYDIEENEWLGRYGGEGGNAHYDGCMDEVRISNICRSLAWIKTSFNNLSARCLKYAPP